MGSIIYQVQEVLKEQMRDGDSRYSAKIAEGTHTPEGIFTYDTLETYLKQCCSFAKWVHAEHKYNTLKKTRPYIEAYLQYNMDRGLSPNTLTTQRSALCKLYKCHAQDLNIKLPERRRADIKRSRGKAVRDYGFSEENNKDVINFAKATGLRRHELEALSPHQIQYEDGEN
ncbi:site-specific integrase [Christensenella intestinihominis]|uniref:site-specific integrase n=1 Tax=Christensenella intestinihominis TaxID=1851429 RepID=UPI0008312740|nr:site-specific integrase [Christensenella intestinihominis]